MRETYETIRVEVASSIVTLTLNRPEKMNAINAKLNHEAMEVLDELTWDEQYRVLIITGAGSAFSAGGDFRSGVARSTSSLSSLEFVRHYQEEVIALLEKVRLFPRITIAAVNGWALGNGFTLAMLCDYVIAASDARMGIPQIKRGGLPIGLKSAITFLPHRYALHHLLSGEDMTGTEAERLLVINKAVAKERVLPEAYALAEKMSEMDPVVVRFLKRAFWREKYLPYNPETLEMELMANLQVVNIRQAMGQQGFVEK